MLNKKVMNVCFGVYNLVSFKAILKGAFAPESLGKPKKLSKSDIMLLVSRAVFLDV